MKHTLEKYGTMKLYLVSKGNKDKGLVIAAHSRSAINKAKKQYPECDTVTQTIWSIQGSKHSSGEFKKRLGPF